jgi:hypothetical protein
MNHRAIDRFGRLDRVMNNAGRSFTKFTAIESLILFVVFLLATQRRTKGQVEAKKDTPSATQRLAWR